MPDMDKEQLDHAKKMMTELSKKKWEDQAIHFLNAYWSEPSLMLCDNPEICEKVKTNQDQ